MLKSYVCYAKRYTLPIASKRSSSFTTRYHPISQHLDNNNQGQIVHCGLSFVDLLVILDGCIYIVMEFMGLEADLQINYGRFCTACTCEEVGWMYFGKQWPERRPLFTWEPCGYLQYFPCQHRPICDREAYKGFAFRRRGRMAASEPGEWFAIRCHGSFIFQQD